MATNLNRPWDGRRQPRVEKLAENVLPAVVRRRTQEYSWSSDDILTLQESPWSSDGILTLQESPCWLPGMRCCPCRGGRSQCHQGGPPWSGFHCFKGPSYRDIVQCLLPPPTRRAETARSQRMKCRKKKKEARRKGSARAKENYLYRAQPSNIVNGVNFYFNCCMSKLRYYIVDRFLSMSD